MFLGVDIGTSSSKAVLVSASGKVVASATRSHGVSTPRPEWFEHDADATWWGEACALIRELGTAGVSAITAVGVSAIGPTLLVSDEIGRAHV